VTDKRLKLDRSGYTDAEAVKMLFPQMPARYFRWGFVFGCLFMAILNIGDVHICVGECDGGGFTLRSDTP